MRSFSLLISFFFLLVACNDKSTSPKQPYLMTSSHNADSNAYNSEILLKTSHRYPASNDFSDNPAVVCFIEKMVSKYRFDQQQLRDVFAQAKRLDSVLRLMDQQAPNHQAPSEPDGAWIRYRNQFIQPDNIQKGVLFWQQYQATLNRAQQIYGVPAEIIVGIIGVESRWGRVMGRTRIIDALATLAFYYPRRASFFSHELETFLVMARDEHIDPLALRGSFAGAMGYGQFMPSAFKNYAVDFNNDGQINLWDSVDAIGSIANYFKQYGWVKNHPIAIPVRGQASKLDSGYHTRYSIEELSTVGFIPKMPVKSQYVSLLRFDIGSRYQYWFGFSNFYVITRYNHSNYYAMAVWKLGEAVAQAHRQYTKLSSKATASVL